ncbi:MAG: ATP-binding protein [Candidatus Cloacimonadaceae bacterium]|jgi:signal transduction histidine kinase|nr:cyclic nucleotide-binding domain-containing protein [Candidatus Cloacimonadota bacterium]MDX9948894.1 ATP-binding protein [Candidatus Syntrophosphaera sp.]
MSHKQDKGPSAGLFQGLDKLVVESFISDLNTLALRKGGVKNIDYATEEKIYYIANGSVTLTPDPGSEPEAPHTVQAGEFFGESILRNISTGSASVKALEKTELIEIPRDKFIQFSFSHPLALINVIRILQGKPQEGNHEFSDLMGDMIQNSRLSAIGMTASKIIHDIKTPLTVISLTAQLVESLFPDSSEFAKSIVQQTKLIDALVRELMDYVKGSPNEIIPRQVDMHSFLHDIAEAYGASLKGRNISLKLENRCDQTVYFDVERVRRVLMNLLRNSSEAIEDSGEIHICASLSSNWLQIRITDNGPGIPESIADQLFSPFFTYNKSNGTGLGLPICQKLIKEHGGRIEYSPIEPHGARFDIRIPQVMA